MLTSNDRTRNHSRVWPLALALLLIATVTAAQDDIRVTSADPETAEQGIQDLEVMVGGENFPSDPEVSFYVHLTEDPGGITVKKVKRQGPKALKVTIDIAADAETESFDIEVRSGGRKGKGTELFGVTKKQLPTPMTLEVTVELVDPVAGSVAFNGPWVFDTVVDCSDSSCSLSQTFEADFFQFELPHEFLDFWLQEEAENCYGDYHSSVYFDVLRINMNRFEPDTVDNSALLQILYGPANTTANWGEEPVNYEVFYSLDCDASGCPPFPAVLGDESTFSGGRQIWNSAGSRKQGKRAQPCYCAAVGKKSDPEGDGGCDGMPFATWTVKRIG